MLYYNTIYIVDGLRADMSASAPALTSKPTLSMWVLEAKRPCGKNTTEPTKYQARFPYSTYRLNTVFFRREFIMIWIQVMGIQSHVYLRLYIERRNNMLYVCCRADRKEQCTVLIKRRKICVGTFGNLKNMKNHWNFVTIWRTYACCLFFFHSKFFKPIEFKLLLDWLWKKQKKSITWKD